MPENGNLPARANPRRAGKMKSRQISLALFIKFDNRYRPLEGQKHSAVCHLEGGRKYGGDPSNTSSQSFSHSDVRDPWVYSHLHVCDATLISFFLNENTQKVLHLVFCYTLYCIFQPPCT